LFTNFTGIDVYFPSLYHSWERGSNKNFNGPGKAVFSKRRRFYTDLGTKNKRGGGQTKQ